MASYFLDSSALVKAYIDEPGSQRVHGIFSTEPPPEIYIAHITHVEVIAALARRSRGTEATAAQAAEALSLFRQAISADIYNTIGLSVSVLKKASNLAQAHYLRGYDAVQLAAAMEGRAARENQDKDWLRFMSADEDLNRAAAAEGFIVEDPTEGA